MSNLLHCDIGEVVQYLKEQNKVFYAIRLSDCLQHSNESIVKLTIENQKLRVELREIKDGFEGCCLACEPVGEMNKKLREERDEARLQMGRILNEIDCRIEHGAESNGHLEAIYNLFKENSNV